MLRSQPNPRTGYDIFHDRTRVILQSRVPEAELGKTMAQTIEAMPRTLLRSTDVVAVARWARRFASTAATALLMLTVTGCTKGCDEPRANYRDYSDRRHP